MNQHNTDRSVSVVAKGFSFLEGPRWRDGLLYVSDFYQHRVFTVNADGHVNTLCEIPGQPSGTGFTPDGRLLIVSMKDRKVLRLENQGLVTVADLSAATPYYCNDMVVDHKGRAYVGNFGWDLGGENVIQPTVLLLIHEDGHVSVAAEDIIFPNGTALTPDGKTLIVAETFASRISAFDIAEDGSLRKRRTWASFSNRKFRTVADCVTAGDLLPDGIALDAEGALWVSDALGHGAVRIAEGGKVLDYIDTGALAVFATGLGGSDRRTLYMCAAPPFPDSPAGKLGSCVLSCRVDVPGVGLP